MATQVSEFARAFAREQGNRLHSSVNVLKAKDGHERAKEAMLDWHISESKALFNVGEGKAAKLRECHNKKVLYRSDTEHDLCVVSEKYKIVQPETMLSFFDEVAKEYGFVLEMAGQTLGGRRVWGMAKTPMEMEVIKGDKMSGYLLFVTGCDVATTALFSGIRLWCLNQMPMLMRQARTAKGRGVVRITHSAKFEPSTVKAGLKLMHESWDEFEKNAKLLAKTKVSREDAIKFFVSMTRDEGEAVDQKELDNKRSIVHRMIETYDHGQGQEKIVGTAWGLLNGVSRFVDHEARAKDSDSRLYRAWMSSGARMKAKAYEHVLALT